MKNSKFRKILITGSSGMLGRALCEEFTAQHEIVGLDILAIHDSRFTIHEFIECDITDREKTIEAIASAKPDIVIHTAAYTDVDGCEQNPEKAHRINAQGTETIALACRDCAALLCYISTDFVFDGEKKSAYTESDEPNPINIYGKSKLDGERFAQSILKEFIIVRSSWLFGRSGRNFVDVILKQAQNEKEARVINDQFGSPTCVLDLAQAINRLINLSRVPRPASRVLKNIYHITNSGSCSWYEFAQAVKEIANLDIDIVPISSKQYRSPTRRPKMSILENRRYEESTGEKLRHWREALRKYLLSKD